MGKSPLTGIPIREDAEYIVLAENGAVAKYSREKFYLVAEPEQPPQLIYGLHAIAVPFGQ
ncbi:hypothetical protein [Cohnella sp. JJ-181]|uniref:hypothetical protein n=1 Tax=Cohnella rhizoplanae TaxID=2974897 RepID=UPI0022FFC245|nr:hypothetical protein [Cohnella sp. JJ-181]CAI6087230.1 hypothetical protein COHCIP112018_05402 [Cohnella sp. JJ-181]